MKLKHIPILGKEMIMEMEDMSYFTHALIFDDLLIVAQKQTACFVWKTSEGLVIVDAIWPCEEAYRAVVNAIKDVGWNPEDISKLVITHGHVDHTGCGRYFVERHHAKTYLSEIDDTYWRENPTKPDRPETWKDYTIDTYVTEGDCIPCGDKSIYVYSTPGHTPGCLSYIFPVMENKEVHMAALFGGTTPPWSSKEGAKLYKQSIDHFLEKAKEKKVDVALCNHIAFDNGLERIAYSKNRLGHMPNIYIIGEEGFDKFCNIFKLMANMVH